MSELKLCPFCQMAKYLKIKNSYCEEFSGYYGFEVICDATGFEGHEKGCGASGSWGETEESAATAWNTRAVPDAPELVRYNLHRDGNYVGAMPSPSGEYVLHSGAAAVIAAKNAEIARLSIINSNLCKSHGVLNVTSARLEKRAEAAEAELAEHKAARQSYADLFDGDVGSIHENIRNLKSEITQINDQEPIAYTAKPNLHWLAQGHYGSIVVSAEKSTENTEPLYATPVTSDAELREENERLRAALEKIAVRSHTTGLLWWQIEGRAALNPSETQT